jgi:hypothetical protein
MSVTVKSVALKLDTENALLRAEMAKMKADFDERLGLSKKKIENLSARLVLTESTIALQKNTIEVLQGHISLQRDKVKNQDQYHRRPNLRINSVVLPKPGESESNEDRGGGVHGLEGPVTTQRHLPSSPCRPEEDGRGWASPPGCDRPFSIMANALCLVQGSADKATPPQDSWPCTIRISVDWSRYDT